MYLIQIDHRVYERRGSAPGRYQARCGRSAASGTRASYAWTATPVVTSAGSDYAVTYAPTGRTVERRRVRR